MFNMHTVGGHHENQDDEKLFNQKVSILLLSISLYNPSPLWSMRQPQNTRSLSLHGLASFNLCNLLHINV